MHDVEVNGIVMLDVIIWCVAILDTASEDMYSGLRTYSHPLL